MALSRRGVDDPLRAMHEAEVLRQVPAEIGEAAERYEVPETASTRAFEQSPADHARDRAIRRPVVCHLQPGGLHDSEALESPRPAPLRVSRNARVRPGVDQGPAGCENPVNLA